MLYYNSRHRYDGQLTDPDYSSVRAGRSTTRRNGGEATMPNTLYVAMEQDRADKAEALRTARPPAHTMRNTVYAVPLDAPGQNTTPAADVPTYGAMHDFGAGRRRTVRTTHVVDVVPYVVTLEGGQPADYSEATAVSASGAAKYATLYAEESINPSATARNYVHVSAEEDAVLYSQAVDAEQNRNAQQPLLLPTSGSSGYVLPADGLQADARGATFVHVGGYQVPMDDVGGYDSQLTEPADVGTNTGYVVDTGAQRVHPDSRSGTCSGYVTNTHGAAGEHGAGVSSPGYATQLTDAPAESAGSVHGNARTLAAPATPVDC